MAVIVAQAGDSLYKIDPTTGVSEELTLPTGVTLRTDARPRFAALNRWVVMTNTPSENLAISGAGDVFLLTLDEPATAPTLATNSTGLFGHYKYRISFIIKSNAGELGTESKLGPLAEIDLDNEGVDLTNIPVSLDTVPAGYYLARRIYRTTADGSLFYHLADIEDNTTTTYSDQADDAGLSVLPYKSTVLDDPPGSEDNDIHMKLLVMWKKRLWGVSDNPADVSQIFYTDDGSISNWGNSLVQLHPGDDDEGIVALVPRRDQLLVLTRTGVQMITGSSNADFNIVDVETNKAGCVAPDSVVSVGDDTYWLGPDGVYRYGADGVENISNSTVAPWFKKDTYFNREVFPDAFAKYNELIDQYELHLAPAGSEDFTRWVAYNRTNKRWYGIHATTAFTPVSAVKAANAQGQPVVAMGGSDGFIYLQNQETYADDGEAIEFDVIGPFHHDDSPDVEHHWGQLSILTKIEDDGTLRVTPTVGNENSFPGPTMLHDLTKGRELLKIVGDGRLCRLRFYNNEVNQGVSIRGYELPVHEVGRR